MGDAKRRQARGQGGSTTPPVVEIEVVSRHDEDSEFVYTVAQQLVRALTEQFKYPFEFQDPVLCYIFRVTYGHETFHFVCAFYERIDSKMAGKILLYNRRMPGFIVKGWLKANSELNLQSSYKLLDTITEEYTPELQKLGARELCLDLFYSVPELKPLSIDSDQNIDWVKVMAELGNFNWQGYELQERAGTCFPISLKADPIQL